MKVPHSAPTFAVSSPDVESAMAAGRRLALEADIGTRWLERPGVCLNNPWDTTVTRTTISQRSQRQNDLASFLA
jgi:hypothetical protein